MKSVMENEVSDVLGQDHLHAIIEQVRNLKDDIPHCDKNFRKILAYRPTL